MDFDKLNNEFMNMQSIIKKYNQQTTKIKNKFKNNLKEINKYEGRIKSCKDDMVKEMYKIIIISIQEQNVFLNSLLEERERKDVEMQ